MEHPGSRHLLEQIPLRPDIVHLHNLHSTHPYFDLRILPALSHSIPTFITLHDAWLTTGHCAHSFGCDRWQTGCGKCPDLTIYPSIRRDATAQNWIAKRDIFAASKLHVITPSHWLMQRAEESIVWPVVRDSRVIPNGVDPSVFKPAPKAEIRTQLNLPTDQPVLLAMTGGKGNQFKDRTTLLAAIEQLSTLINRPLTVVLLGEEPKQQMHGNATIQSLPSVSPQKVAQYLSAADLMLHAAHVDTFPTSILEAMACGTPVVATAVGGIPEQIRTDKNPTGCLVPPADPMAMAQVAHDLLADEALRAAMSQNAIKLVNEKFTLTAQVDTLEAYYRTTITS
jgi:glycosyltransferase involved in cell wall biosynthesis